MQTTLFEQPTFPVKDFVHQHEATAEGTKFVQDNKHRLNAACLTCLRLMCEGVRLSDDYCTNRMISRSLSSRCSELKKAGIVVSKEWKIIGEQKVYKEYFLSEDEIEKAKKFLG